MAFILLKHTDLMLDLLPLDAMALNADGMVTMRKNVLLLSIYHTVCSFYYMQFM